MKALWTAIYNKYSGSALPASTTGELHFTTAPAGVSTPFAVYSQITDSSEWTFSTDDERVLIQFSLFDRGSNPTSLATLRDSWVAVFDDCALTVAGYTVDYMQRLPGGGAWTKDENDFWQCIEEYEILLYKNR